MSVIKGQGLYPDKPRRFNPAARIGVGERVVYRNFYTGTVAFAEVTECRGFRYRIKLDDGKVFSVARQDLRKAK